MNSLQSLGRYIWRMTLSPEEISHYHREGYVLVRGLVSAEVCAEVRKRAIERGAPGPGITHWTPLIFDHRQPDEDPALHRILADPSVIAAIEQLLGSDAKVYYGMAAMVPPNGGRGLPWHQDNQYQHVLHHALNTFIAVSDITTPQCTLWVAPRSHLSGVVANENAADFNGHKRCTQEPVGGMPLPDLKAGDACIFNRNTIHRSLTNQTPNLRVAYAAQYVEAAGVVADTGEPAAHWMTANSLRQRWQ